MVHINFNQDVSSLAIGSKDGYQLFTLSNIGKIERIHLNSDEKEAFVVERLFSSSLIVVVSRSAPNLLKVCHFRKGTEICSYTYPSEVLTARLNRQRLVVCLRNEFYIHNIRDMKLLHTLAVEIPNDKGLFALTNCNEASLLAYPVQHETGTIEIFDTIALETLLTIPAHNNQLAAIAFTSNGDKIATASIKGTVVRIFSTADGTKLYEFRRGLKRCVNISSLSFSPDGTYLAASSNTETVHVFKLDQRQKLLSSEEDRSWAGYMTSALKSSAASFIPATVSDAFTAWRAFATARLSEGNRYTVCGLPLIKKIQYVVTADETGLVHIFKLDSVNGGECEVVHTKRLETRENYIYYDAIIDSDVLCPSEKGQVKCEDSPTCDASYAYKLKREKRFVPNTPSQELNEILDNVPTHEYKDPQVTSQFRLDDASDFPPMK